MASVVPIAALTDVNAEHECLDALSDTAQELIKFRLYEDTEGVWVCCDWCHKWRYVAEQKDPAFFLKRDFLCKDVNKKCNVGIDKGSDQTFYETKFCAGSLVWAKRPDGRKEKDWPWWPALVEDSPDAVSQYFLLDGSGSEPIAYHVTFLDAYRTSGWVGSKLIKPFDPQTKGLNKASASRAGKKQRFLREALERAKNAATFDVKDRLESFSYIAHMARLKGLIRQTKQPADTILNGTDLAPDHQISPDRTEKENGATSARRGRGRPKKRKLETDEVGVVKKKTVSPVGSADEAPQPLDSELVREMPVEISTNIDPKMEMDSGYEVDEGSPIESPPTTGRARVPAQPTKIPKEESESFNMSEISSPGVGDEFQPNRDAPDKAKKRAPAKSAKKKETTLPNAENVKTSRKKKPGENVVQETQITSSEPVKASKKRLSKRKTSPPEDSVVESSPVNTANEGVSDPRNTASENYPVVPDSEGTDIVPESGTASSDFDSRSLGFEAPMPEENTETAAQDSEPNTLESTSNLKVVRKRRPKAQNAVVDENKPSKPAFSTQAARKERSTKTLGLSKRIDTAGSVRPPPDISMSQPLPSKTRGKFAPPTRAKPKADVYDFDAFERDMEEENI